MTDPRPISTTCQGPTDPGSAAVLDGPVPEGSKDSWEDADGRRTLTAMFARYFLELAVSPAAIEAALMDTPAEWLSDVASDADDYGSRLLVDVGVGRTPSRIGKQVRVELGAPTHLPSRMLLPVRWNATGPAALFPSLDGDLEVGALGPGRTQLSLSATYTPPLGRVGKVLDRALLHRLAEATVKDFLDRLGASLQDRVHGAPTDDAR